MFTFGAEIAGSISLVPGIQERRVFSACLKAFCDGSGARSAGSRLFQVVGPLMAKLRCRAVKLIFTIIFNVCYSHCMAWLWQHI